VLKARCQGGGQEYSPGEQGVRDFYIFTLLRHFLLLINWNLIGAVV
jgi:hypothetical protein